jgi:hypothetical protein
VFEIDQRTKQLPPPRSTGPRAPSRAPWVLGYKAAPSSRRFASLIYSVCWGNDPVNMKGISSLGRALKDRFCIRSPADFRFAPKAAKLLRIHSGRPAFLNPSAM